jgi:hypothetical protein
MSWFFPKAEIGGVNCDAMKLAPPYSITWSAPGLAPFRILSKSSVWHSQTVGTLRWAVSSVLSAEIDVAVISPVGPKFVQASLR